ncbi:Lrp/AsnC family transcriptional regulator [Microbacterium sp.]|uniref:Lrp/AsnC family transcriptional regulator n=1 Tax=Microbacterium sp. TaxID=51671 RepID=UPI0031FF0F91|nr:Lrp/AsnC family transcriptional regulator [Microbacterium sp.]
MTDHHFDEIERQLLRELQTDARQSNVALAKKVGLTEGAVRRRIDKLLKTGKFRVVAVGDPELLGLQTHAVIGLKIELTKIEQLSEELAQMRELSYVYETTGQFDIIIVGFFASNDRMREFLTHKLAPLAGIVDIDTFLVMRTVKRSFRWGERVAPTDPTDPMP